MCASAAGTSVSASGSTGAPWWRGGGARPVASAIASAASDASGTATGIASAISSAAAWTAASSPCR